MGLVLVLLRVGLILMTGGDDGTYLKLITG